MDPRAIPLLQDLSPQELQAITRQLEPVALKAGDVLFAEGDLGDALYIVERGKLQIAKRVRTDSAETLPILTVGPGGCVGELALLDDAPRSSTVQAVEATALLRLSKDRFLSLIRSRSAIGAKLLLNLARTVAPRIRQVNQQLAVLFEVGRTLASGLEDVDRALSRTLQTLQQGLRADRACLFFVNTIGESFDLRASVGRPVPALSMPLKRPAGTLSALPGITTPQRLTAGALKELSGSRELQGWELESNLVLPITANSHPMAYLVLSRSQPPFSDDDLNLAHSASLQMGQFMERARLHQDLGHQDRIKREYFRI